VHVFSVGWKMLVILLTVIYMFKAVNIDVLPILASAGVLGLAVAFGAQQLVRDFFSGFFILLENQFRVGDSVVINGLSGQVERITPRITLVRSLTEGSLHYIPNGSISHVSNNSREWGAIKLVLPVSYHADPSEVLACLQHVTDELLADPHYNAKLQKVWHLGIEEFGELAVTYAVLLKCKPTEQWPLAREYRRRVKAHFEEAGIDIPSLSDLSGDNKPSLAKRRNKPS
jgi:moderate conductance mechanosensitive channel